MAKKKAQAPTDAVRNYLSQIGRKGGLAGTGPAKARDSEKMRAAVNKRWARARESKQQEDEKSKD